MEIGSEFWSRQNTDNSCNTENIYVLSGRTALDYIIRDMKAENPGIMSVYIPDYCCDSMIAPFIRNKIYVMFYHVYINRTGFHVVYNDNPCDVVYLTDYFGYRIPELAKIAEEIHTTGKKIIYDATHMLNGMNRLKYDYLFCSYRKWFYSNSTIVIKNTPFLLSAPEKINESYVSARDKAASLKREYMAGRFHDKQCFLDLFKKAEEILDYEYEGYGSDETPEFDEGAMVSKRRINARIILQEIEKIENLSVIIDTIENWDCPLFVPVLIPSGMRENVRRELIKQQVYCPIHWPLTKYHKGIKNNIYMEELSLVCDQRYGVDDMRRECEALRKVMGFVV